MSAGECQTKNLIILGQSASGKSTMAALLRDQWMRLGRKVLYLNDGKFLMDLVQKDTDCFFHRPLGGGDFMVTDTRLYDQAAEEVYSRAESAQKMVDCVLVEMSCGQDKDGGVDITLPRRLALMPAGLRESCQLIYIVCSKEKRFRHNEQREGLWRLPELVMRRFFGSEDPPLDFINSSRHNPWILNNNGTRKDFLKEVRICYASIEGYSSRKRVEGR